MYGTADQVGQQLVCPDCDTKVLVPAAIRPAGDAGASIEVSAHEGYDLLEGIVQPAADSPLVTTVHIPVFCGVCRTRMLATLDLVGRQIVCPDCGTPAIVPPPPLKPAAPEESPRTGPDAEYAMSVGVDQPPPGSEAYAEHVAVHCKVCHTLLHYTLDQVGQTAVCPDCGTLLVVPPPRPKPSMGPEILNEPEPAGYAVAAPSRRDLSPVIELPPELAKKYEISTSDRAKVPRWPFLAGVFPFPFYPGVWQRWVTLAVTAPMIGAVGLAAAEMAMQGYGALMAVPLLAATGFLSTVWIGVLGSVFLKVVADTSAGADRIEEWPAWLLIDSLLDALYFFTSLGVAVLPGVAIAWLLAKPESIIPAISAVILFPIAFLSTLESDSPMKPFSIAVLRSLGTSRGRWTRFYLETTAILLLTAALVSFVVRLLGIIGGFTPSICLALVAVLLYARLLGRLGWCTSQDSLERDDP